MAKPATRKPAAARKTAAAAPATRTATKSGGTGNGPPGTATIKFSKDKYGGTVRGAVNGDPYRFPTGVEVQATAAQLNSLNDSYVEYETITPLAGEDAAEGSAASSTLHNTATRLEPAAAAPTLGEDGEPAAPTELSQRTDKELTEDSQQASKDQAGEGGEEAKS